MAAALCQRAFAAHILLWIALPGLPISAVFDFPSPSCGGCVLLFSYQSFSFLSMGFFKGRAPSSSTPGSGVDGDCAVAIRCSLSLWTYFFLLISNSFRVSFLFLFSKKITSSLITRHELSKMCQYFEKFFKNFCKKEKAL